MVWKQDEPGELTHQDKADAMSPRALAQACVEATKNTIASHGDYPSGLIKDYYRVSKAYLELEDKFNKALPAVAASRDVMKPLMEFIEQIMKVREKYKDTGLLP